MNSTRYVSPVDSALGRRDAVAVSGDGGPGPAPVRAQLRFAAFGRFRAELDGSPAPLPPITCTMLARLVLARGGLVAADHLYQDGWPEPAVAVKREQRVAVHKRIAELRRYLDMEHATGGSSVLLTDRAARTGYRLVLNCDQVDIYRFEDLICRAAATQDAVAVDLLTQALAMWTERPLLGLPDKAFVRDAVSRLVALRDRACRELATVCRALGRPRDALAVLDRLRATQPDDRGLNHLIEQLCPGEHDASPALPHAQLTTGLPAVWNVPLRIPDVVSRSGLIARVREQLAHGPVALVGMLGVGKTRLAVEYAHQYAQRYRLVWWLDAEHTSQLDSQLVTAARQIGVVQPDSDLPAAVAELRRYLRSLPSDRTLLIFDNVVNPADLRPWLPDHGHVLITSRNPCWAETAAPLAVEPLTRVESLTLLTSRLPALSRAEADRLAHELGDLPLALAQAANLMATEGMRTGEFLAELAAHPASIGAEGRLASYPVSLTAAIRLAGDRLDCTDPGAAQLLERCVRTGRERVPAAPLRATGRTIATTGTAGDEAPDIRRRLGHIGRSGLARVDVGEIQLHRLIAAILLDRSGQPRRTPWPLSAATDEDPRRGDAIRVTSVPHADGLEARAMTT